MVFLRAGREVQSTGLIAKERLRRLSTRGFEGNFDLAGTVKLNVGRDAARGRRLRELYFHDRRKLHGLLVALGWDDCVVLFAAHCPLDQAA